MKTFEVFERSGFPKVEAASIVVRIDQREFDARHEPENAVAGDFGNAI